MEVASSLIERATRLVQACAARGISIATAESCTGGLVAALLTEVPGSSAAFDRGFVTYSNQAKTEMLGVPAITIERFGAVSAQTATAMAEGAVVRSAAEIAVSITGIAGPGGGSIEKPVGLVWFGIAARDRVAVALERRFDPQTSRQEIRAAAAEQAMSLLERYLDDRKVGSEAADSRAASSPDPFGAP